MFSGGPPVHLMWSNMFDPEKPQVKKPADWRRVGKLFLPYWKDQVQALACMFVVSILGLLPPLFTLGVIDHALPDKDLAKLVLYVAGMVGSALMGSLIGVYQGYLNSKVGEGIVRDIRGMLVSHLHRMPLEFFTSTKTGEIMNRVSNDVDSIDNVLTGTIVTVASNIFTITTTLVTIFVLDWRLAILSILMIPLMILPIWPVGRRMYEVRKRTRKKRDTLSSINQETLSISGIMLIKSFVREKQESTRFLKESTDLMNLEVELAMVGRWFMMVITAMVTVGPAIVWLYGGWLVLQNSLTIGIIVTFVSLMGRLYTPASTLAGVQVQIVSALAVFERIFDYLDMPEENQINQASLPNAIEEKRPQNILGSIEFADVSFQYATQRGALDAISFNVNAGELVAFVGPSGAGKTTITNLVPRFYIAQSGSVKVDGIDVREFNVEALRKHIGIVSQETYLFHDTIAANLRFAKEGATAEELIQAATLANIHDFIASLPEGYETIVGERGHKLSGGERQRLAIARVVLKDPKILILDEATSSLDSQNEALIQAALAPLMRGRTSLVIAHRLSTILAADRIFVVKQGRIVETGKHAQLLKDGSHYAELYRVQFKEA